MRAIRVLGSVYSKMAFLVNLVRTIGKPIANVINGIIQSLDDSGKGREEIARRYGIVGRFNGDIDRYRFPSETTSLDYRTVPLDDMTPEEREAASALFAIDRVREMNILLKEIPLLGYDEYIFEDAQSYELVIPSGLSVVQSHFCSPIMNLGAKFLKIATEYRAFKVLGVQLDVSFQNQNYSTQTIAYDTLVTKANQREMQNDLLGYMTGRGQYATGHRVIYFRSTNEGPDPVLPDGSAPESLSAYMNVLSRIKSLPTAKDYGQLVAGNLAIENPSYVMVGMRPGVVSSPEIHAGMSYFQTSYALDFFKKIATDGDNINIEQMPVFGKFHYAVSNNFTEPIRLITTLKYKFSCKRHINSATYTVMNNDPTDIRFEETATGKLFDQAGLS